MEIYRKQMPGKRILTGGPSPASPAVLWDGGVACHASRGWLAKALRGKKGRFKGGLAALRGDGLR